MANDPERSIPRRRLLQLAAATATAGASAGLSGCIDVFDSGSDEPETVELEGHSSGWVGVAPESIEGEENPTLELTEGETYELTWENADGQPHNFEILDGDGEAVVETEIVEEQGENQTLEIEAAREMAVYRCGPHPSSMRGTVQVGEPTPTPSDPDPAVEKFLPEGPTVGLETVAEGLTYPTDLADPDDGSGRLLVTDQLGKVRVIGPDGLEDEPFLDVSDRLVDVGLDAMGGFDERGLLGIECHPDFSENGRLFLRYSSDEIDTPEDFGHAEVLSEFETDGDLERAAPDSERILLEIPQPSFDHNSGNVLFGPDGYLYVTTGDGGGGISDRPDDWYEENDGGYGQDTERTLLGGVLRIDVDHDGEGEYAIPEDNPLIEQPGYLDEYYAWGFRNPWGASFDGDDLYVADVGELLFEIVNRVEKGGNYGWNVKEGTHCFSTETLNDPPADCPDRTPDHVRGGEPLLDPIIEYPQEVEGTQIGSAVIGGAVYRGGFSELEGRYVFGDWSAVPHGDPAGQLFVASEPDPDESRHEYYEERDLWPIETLRVEHDGDAAFHGDLHRYVSAFGQDQDGEIYVMTTETPAIEGDTGEVHRLVDPDEIE